MKITVSAILALARGEIGVKESPAGSNNVKYNTEYYERVINDPEYAWCAVFIWWLFKMVGWVEAVLRDGVKTASCPYLVQTFKLKGQWVTSGYRPGDVIFFRWSGDSGYDHVGICSKIDGDSITTIEGNYSETYWDNHGAVKEMTRSVSRYVVGAGRPEYAAEPTVQPEAHGGLTYTVVSGDALSVIALRFKTTVAEISTLNGIADPNRIYPGQVLEIPASPAASPGKTYTVRANGGLLVRSGPGKDHKELGLLSSGSEVTVVGESGSWRLIKYKDGTGYCHGDYLFEAPTAASVAGTYICTARDGLRIRDGAGTDHKIVGSIKYGVSVEVTSESNGWYEVPGGWSSADYLDRV